MVKRRADNKKHTPKVIRHYFKVRASDILLKHECQRVFKIALECRQPPCSYCAINSPVVRAESDLHHINRLETALFLGCGYKHRFGGTDGENAGLRRIYDSGEVVNIEHAKIGHSEGPALQGG